MSDKERFVDFFNEFGIESSPVTPEEVFLEMEQDVEWKSALSVGQAWFLFGEHDDYLGLLNDETMKFEARVRAGKS
jgi:hypothetical protein